ncbi:hypothetical protein DSO57_1009516 [Entomophthora muscae]|uniref:Uncharacterized protein n=1 Tax=Entomophthora muscae TaxID=34485 RepID=A0ACC2US97_9FUNG|nr:hypothetical protein DSO57_1009516 [Entomophthora muscae]
MAFGIDYVHIQIPSIAFIIAQYKPLKENFGKISSIHKALLKARENLLKALHAPILDVKARAYLDLIGFFLKKYSIEIL